LFRRIFYCTEKKKNSHVDKIVNHNKTKEDDILLHQKIGNPKDNQNEECSTIEYIKIKQDSYDEHQIVPIFQIDGTEKKHDL